MILALDLGTKTGWAHYSSECDYISGVQNFATKRHEGGGMRYLRFRRWLEGWRPLPTEVYYEEVRRHRGVTAAHVYGSLEGHLMAFCDEHSIPYSGVPVGTIKKHATGKGNAGKPAMIAAAQARGWSPVDDNEADALWILDYARAHLCSKAS